jgi:hypothetical protein
VKIVQKFRTFPSTPPVSFFCSEPNEQERTRKAIKSVVSTAVEKPLSGFNSFQFRGSGSFHFTLAQVEDPPQGENSSEVQYVSINPACFRFTSSFSLLVQRKRSKRKDALLFWFYLNSHHDWKSMNSLCSNSTDFLPS